jgi:hypothetical protein
LFPELDDAVSDQFDVLLDLGEAKTGRLSGLDTGFSPLSLTAFPALKRARFSDLV